MSIRIKAREANLLLTCRSANKVEQVQILRDGLRDANKRKNYTKYQIDETETLEINSRKRSKNIRKTHSEKQMKIPIKESMTIKESNKLGPVSINDSTEDNYKNTHNVKRQTQNYSTKYTADNIKRSSRLNEDYEKAIRSVESSQSSDGPDKKGDSAKKKVVFVSLNFVDKPNKSDRRRKPTYQTKLRRLWKNLQRISNYHKKQKIGRLRKYCCRKPILTVRKEDEINNESNKKYLEKEKFPPRIHSKESQDQKTESTFESESQNSNNSKTEYNANKETSNPVIEEVDRGSLDFIHQKTPHIINKLTPEDDVSKIDEKYLKYILLITNKIGVNGLKNNENQENINDKSDDRDEEIVPKDKKNVKILKVKTSQNQLKIKRIPSITIKDNNRSKEYLIQNKKNLIDHITESEFKPTCESDISNQPTKQKKKFIVLKLSSAKPTNHNEKSRISQKQESGPVNAKESKNNLQKSNPKNPIRKKKETVRTPSRGGMSKSDFIEIWRRNSRKESQESLSSHSSTNPPDNQEKSDEDDSSDCEYLGIRSYQALKNIVEQEVLKIFKSYKKKEENLESERKKTESKTTESTKPPVPIGKKSATITVNKVKLENKVQPTDKQLQVIKDGHGDVKSDRETEPKITLSVQKEKLPPQSQNLKKQENESETLRATTRNHSEEINKKLKILSEQENKDFKIPSEILKNWTIMHRLEKAFLALGTPNFPSKSLPLPRTKVIGSNVTNTHSEKVGSAKSKSRTGNGSIDESKSKPRVDSSKIKITQKKIDARYLIKLETEQKIKKIKTEKEAAKGIKKKDGTNVHDVLHIRKSTQPPSTNKSLELSSGKKTEGISLSTDHKIKIKTRFKPDTLTRVPRKIFENNDSKKKDKLEKPIQTQEVSAKPISTSVKPKPTYNDDSDGDHYLDPKIGFLKEPGGPLVLVCNNVNEIEHDFAEEAKHFDSQMEKLLDLKSSRNLLYERQGQDKIKDGRLERKKTFAIFPIADTTNLKTKKSQSCYKLEVNCKTEAKLSSPTINQKRNSDNWDPFEQDNKKSTHEQYPGIENQKCSSKTKLFIKLCNKHSPKNNDYAFDKTSLHSEDIILTNPYEFSEVQPNKEKMPVEDIPQKLLSSRKETNLNERVVKERSILSLIQNVKKTQRKSSETIDRIPPSKDCKKPQEKTTPDVFLQRLFYASGSQTNSNMSAISTATYDVVTESGVGCDYPGHQTQKQSNDSNKLRPATATENISTTTFKTVGLDQKLPSPLVKTVKIQPNWERDIRQYRALVKDIIDQYKRTKGFLKQNEALLDPLTGTKLIEFQGGPPLSSNFRFLDINEYRRKIISEYRDLSIFEYKSKIQETSSPKEKKPERGLAVVKEVTPEMDYDIKDFQPNVKKVLNSQIYVDRNHFYKLKGLRVKSTEQNPSLQEVMLGTSKVESQQIELSEQSKSACIPKVSLPNSKVYSVLFHTPNHSRVEVDNDFTFDDFMSLSEFEETESDCTDDH